MDTMIRDRKLKYHSNIPPLLLKITARSLNDTMRSLKDSMTRSINHLYLIKI